MNQKSKVSVIILPFRKPAYIKPVFDAIFSQTHRNLEVIAVINDSKDGSKEIINQSYPEVRIIEPGWNSWFAAGNNLGIKAATGDFIQLVNDDLILEHDYIEKLLHAFEDSLVAAATGKLLRYDFARNLKTNIIDTTGVVMMFSGRAFDRGQWEEDRGQYDSQLEVFGVSGAGPMYRKSALEKIKYCQKTDLCEYFDENFLAYWEDVDLSWRLNRAGYKCKFVPNARAYHGRGAGQSHGGYKKFIKFVKHHKSLPLTIRRLNYKNHILMYLKNAKYILHPKFLFREGLMLMYLIVFELKVLAIIPELLAQLPATFRKRRMSKSV